MSVYSTRPVTLTNLQTYPLSSRESKVSVRDFAKPPANNSSLRKFFDSLPNFLAVTDLRNLLAAIQQARKHRGAILWGIGGHVIKVGLGPLLIDLMRRGFISGIAMNGAALVHDFEIALVGNTSEDVESGLGAGTFGMAAETGEYLNQIAKIAMRARLGYADGAALGSASHLDFRLFCSLVQQMHPGGIYLNWGSAVLLPEVFLKAVSVVRNLGIPLRPITTANFDFIQHYRPLQNVVKRPTASPHGGKGEGSRGYAITGHHELLLPLVAAALTSGWPRPSPNKKANKAR